MQDLRHVEPERPETVRAEDLTADQRRNPCADACCMRPTGDGSRHRTDTKTDNQKKFEPRSWFRNARHIPDEELFPDAAEIKTRQELLKTHGIRVRTKVMLSYWETENPSLQIQTQALNTRGNAHWVSD